jgi:uncharacterized membrane protein
MSAVFFVGGLFIILGMFIPSHVQKQFRIMLGITMMLWAIYRFLVTRMRAKQDEDED